MPLDAINRRKLSNACRVVCAAIVAACAALAMALVATSVSFAAKAEADAAAAKDAPQEKIAEKPAAEAPADDTGDGRLIRVRLPLTGNADTHTITIIQRLVAQLSQLPKRDGRRPTLVIELAPRQDNAGFGEGTDFTRALSLANYLQKPEMSAVKTVAYIPKSIKGHGVLIALACDQIAMSPEAELGEASIDEKSNRGVDPKIVSAYKDVVSAKRTVPLAIAVGMVDPRVEVLKIETEEGTEFRLSSELDEIKKKHTIVSQESVKQPGSLFSFTGRDGHAYGLLLASDTDALARGLAMKAADLEQDQSALADRRPVMMRLEGPITSRKAKQVETMIGTEIHKRQSNWIGITIDSEGGDLEACQKLAQQIAALDPREVETVAYVPLQASGGAALIALACNEVVMQPEAHIGGKGTVDIDRETLNVARGTIRESLGKRSGRSWSLILATIDPSVDLFSFQNTKTGDIRYFCDEEAKSQPDADDWKRGARVKPAGEALQLASNRAVELGVASHAVDNVDELKNMYGLNGYVRVAEPNWALELVEALASPGLAILLIVIGFVGVYIELHSPGIGIGAFVAAVAFLLFFWSKFLYGTAEWLEVLLFLGGVFCVLMEVLVLPGFGIFGLGGGAMILASLILASQTFVLPRTESQMIELRHSLTIVAAASLIVIASSIALRRYLPSTPVFRHLLLAPTSEQELVDLDYRESLADFSHLVGQQGTATTNLMPAGKAEFDGQLIDVIAEGLPIDRGTPIVVVKARGSRVQVRAMES